MVNCNLDFIFLFNYFNHYLIHRLRAVIIVVNIFICLYALPIIYDKFNLDNILEIQERCYTTTTMLP